MKLDFGCGPNKADGFTGVDIHPKSNKDITWDLDKFPYPFRDNSIEEIRIKSVLEHLYNPKECLKECHRILKPGGKLYIVTPFIYPYHSVYMAGKDYFRYTEDALRRMLSDFKKVEVIELLGKFRCAMIVINPINIWFARFGMLLDKIFRTGNDKGCVSAYRIYAWK